MKIVSNNVEYHVEIMGEGEPLLLLHGFTGSVETWHFLAPNLSSKYRLIMVDIIGHGKTSSPVDFTRYDIKKVAGDLKQIIDSIGLEKVTILGYSMGGRLALSFACMFPHYVKGLILESASPGLATEEERQIRKENDTKLAEQIVGKGMVAFIDYWETIPLFASQKNLPEEKIHDIRKQRLSNSTTGLANSLLGMGTGAQPSWWDGLQNLDFPVLLITGELDDKFCRIASNMRKLMKNCDLKIISGVGHAIHVEDDEKFGKIVSGFFESIKEEQ
jgi:2-succinyl-6-hydroxy-2,4-cyclohexadiene-1-carboxylate synthase